jgi:uncharacterized membrane protein YqjE
MTLQNTDNGMRDQGMGELFKQLSDDLSTLVRQELKLAQAEMTEKGKKAGVGIGMFGGAGIVGLLALGALTTCLIAALSTGMEVWIAALIVTVVYVAAAGGLAMRGRDRVSEATPPLPEQTIETVKEDAQWAKTQLSSEKR